MNMESSGSTKASLLSFITAPPNTAIAIWGAKPKTLLTEPRTTNKAKASRTDLLNFIINNLTVTKIKQESLRSGFNIHRHRYPEKLRGRGSPDGNFSRYRRKESL